MHVVMFGDQHAETLGGAQVSMRLQRRFLEKAGHTVTIVAPRRHGRRSAQHSEDPGYADLPSIPVTLDREYSMTWPSARADRAVDAVMAGQRYLCTGAQGSLEPYQDPAREQLTNREQTILLQLAQGRSNREVAAALDISVRTVETHRKNIKRKLGISSTAGLTRYALEHGVLQGGTRVSL